jgi:FixJ family two-component response regulator
MQTSHGLVAIVEDDASMRRSIERLLHANQYSTAAFASAEEFLQSGLAERALGLVLDIHLRRSLSAVGSKLPVVFITAFDEDATRAEALAAGCVDCLHKPFEASRLIEALQRGAKP